ncbi:MAG: adenylate/guanylate cyclase domain-containing protein [Spirochaetia bacterium]|nr:adenylate/guanylate cyclase domain-containing protein [Spirochaetia bacterium]
MRRRLSSAIAGFFLHHLRAELTKPPRLTQLITSEGASFQAVTENMISQLVAEFPQANEFQPSFNLFKLWWESLPVSVPYEETTFKSYNQGFWNRLLDLKMGTESSRRALLIRFRRIVDLSRERGRDLTYEFIYSGESRMNECLRRVVTEHGLGEDAWSLVVEQHDALNRATYSFFDNALKESLKKTDDILYKILPARIAEQLKNGASVRPVRVPSASIMFADIVGFTQIAEALSPEELAIELDRCFSHFDAIMDQNNLEKIKTIGDSYMCAGGILEANQTHPVDSVLCGLRIQEFMRKYKKSREMRELSSWRLRIGIHTGSVAAGVIGLNRYNFDVWGDTVNIASRAEASGQAGLVNITASTRELVKDFFDLEHRGKVAAKNKGEIDMYFVKGILPELSVAGRGKVPNRKFHRLYLGL